MKKLLLTLLCSAGLLVSQAEAQTKRYVDPVFEGVKLTKNIKYATAPNGYGTLDPIDLYLNLYEPVGDTETKRPLLIVAHAGSFVSPALLPLIFGTASIGTKEDETMNEIARRFTKMGYVVASIEYRSGWNPTSQDISVRKGTIMQAAWRAIQDGRAATRFLRKNADQYKIDESKIAILGSQSGGYIPVHMAYFDKPVEIACDNCADPTKLKDPNNKAVIDTTVLNGFNIPWGYPEVSDKFKIGIALNAAVADSSFIEGGEIPMLSVHGIENNTPYGTDIVSTSSGQQVVEVSGGRDMMARATRRGNQEVLREVPDAKPLPFADKGILENGTQITIPGLYTFSASSMQYQVYGFTEKSTAEQIAVAKTHIDTVMMFIVPRMNKVLELNTAPVTVTPGEDTVDDLISSVNEAQVLRTEVKMYPNPTTGDFSIALGNSGVKITRIDLFDYTGRLVQSVAGSQDWKQTVNLNGVSQGLYTVRLSTDNGQASQRLLVK